MRKKWLSANKTKFLFKDRKFNSWLKKIMAICSFKRKKKALGSFLKKTPEDKLQTKKDGTR